MDSRGWLRLASLSGLGLIVSGSGAANPSVKISARVMHKFDKTKTACMHEKCRWVAARKQQVLVS